MQFTDPLSIFFFVLGLMFGSFGNVLIYRLPRGESLRGRSKCPDCKSALQISEIIPIVSFIMQRGKCRHCGKDIPPLYPAVELSGGALFVLALFLLPTSVSAAFVLALAIWLLFIIAIIDSRTQGIPDVLNIPFVVVAIFFAVSTGSLSLWPPFIAAGFLFIQWAASSGRWVGSGDIILAAGIGFLLGDLQRVILALALSYIIGGAIAGWLLLTKQRTRREHLPFGPFLAVGALLTLLTGEQLLVMLM